MRLLPYQLDRAQRLKDYCARLSYRGYAHIVKLLQVCNYYSIKVKESQYVFGCFLKFFTIPRLIQSNTISD